MARPFAYLATAPRAAVRVSEPRTQAWINRYRSALDSNQEGKAP